ncbi:MAG: imidazole glycerol phosphate synthase subunit HisH [Pseudomonadota bacterium]
MTTAIIDYGSGNLRSAAKAFERMSREQGDSGAPIVVTGDADLVARADRIVLPGVGAFADCRAGLMAVDGMMAAIAERVAAGQPFLGICVGMQLMATRGLEHGETPGFDWIGGDVVRLEPDDPGLKVPHMGWNALDVTAGSHPVLDGIASGDHAYFVHSYHLRTATPAHRLAHASHGEQITAIVGRDTMVGTQFHPEKSQATGLRLIANFLGWSP